MRRIAVLLALWSLCLIPLLGTPPAWAFRAVDSDLDVEGYAALLDANRGKVVLVDYWATWCPPCRMEVPTFVRLYREYREQGFEIIAVSLDREREDVQEFIRDYEVTYPVYLATADLKSAQKVSILPTTILVDRTGKEVSRHIGMVTEDLLEKELRDLLAQP